MLEIVGAVLDPKLPQIDTVCAFIYNDFSGVTKVFLAKRANTKDFLPGAFELPGGHVEPHDSSLEAALTREIDEEFGERINIGKCYYAFRYDSRSGSKQTVEYIYFAQFVGEITSVRLNPEDHSEFGWFSENELEYATTPEKNIDDDEFVAIRAGFSSLREAHH